MTDNRTTPPSKRQPQVFDASDPALMIEAPPPELVMAPKGRGHDKTAAVETGDAAKTTTDAPVGTRVRGFWLSWPALLTAALGALASLAAGVAFAQFVSIVLARTDWVGMTGWALLALAALAGLVIVTREMIGLMRLGRLAHLRREAESALRSRDIAAERGVVRRLRRALGRRPELAWAASRFAEHENDVRDPGDLLALADRELVAPLDMDARRLILGSAKRVSLVTAMSPVAFVAVGFVLVENMSLLRRLATLYGGRPGFLGGMRLARMVFVHILATGGVALTDDLIGQFIGQDLARRLSRRLGEGLFNGALTARIGVAALEVCRPLPYVGAKPVRIRDILTELTRRGPAAGAK